MVNLLLCVAAVWTVATATGPPSQRERPLPEHFTAFAVGLGGPGTNPVATPVDITIERWSTPEEIRRLLRTLDEDGADAMLETLRQLQPVGTIRTPDSLAYDLRYAVRAPREGGGRRITIATDRPISFSEAWAQPRSIDYPFTLIELRMNPDGEGEGKLALATRVVGALDGSMIQLENYAAQPIQLTEVRRRPDRD